MQVRLHGTYPSPILNGGVLICSVFGLLSRKGDDFAIKLLRSSRKLENRRGNIGMTGDGLDGRALGNTGATDGEGNVDIRVWPLLC